MIFFRERAFGPDAPPQQSGGGGEHGSGTLAARPATPSTGDTYEVTSGAGQGDLYECFIAGTWRRVYQARTVYPASAQLRYELTGTSGTVANTGAASSANLTAPVTAALGRLAPTGTRGVLFPGGGAYTVLTGAGGYLPTTAASLSFWFKTPSAVTGQVLACKAYQSGAWGGPACSVLLWFDGSGIIQAILETDAGGVSAEGPIPTPTLWHHIALTWDGRYLRLFLDGELVDDGDVGSGGHSIVAHASPGQWGFGGRSESSDTSQQYSGRIAGPIIVTSTTRSAAEFAEEYQRGLGRPVS